MKRIAQKTAEVMLGIIIASDVLVGGYWLLAGLHSIAGR